MTESSKSGEFYSTFEKAEREATAYQEAVQRWEAEHGSGKPFGKKYQESVAQKKDPRPGLPSTSEFVDKSAPAVISGAERRFTGGGIPMHPRAAEMQASDRDFYARLREERRLKAEGLWERVQEEKAMERAQKLRAEEDEWRQEVIKNDRSVDLFNKILAYRPGLARDYAKASDPVKVFDEYIAFYSENGRWMERNDTDHYDAWFEREWATECKEWHLRDQRAKVRQYGSARPEQRKAGDA